MIEICFFGVAFFFTSFFSVVVKLTRDQVVKHVAA